MSKKKILGISVIVVIVIALIGTAWYFYLQEYQKIVAESVELSDTHCIAVNPLIIDKKTAYIGSMKSIIASDSAAYISAQYSWLGSAKEYLELEKLWLRNEKEFLERGETKLLLSTEAQEAANWQYKIYLGEYQATQDLVKLFDSKNVNLREVHEKMLAMDSERKISQQSYDLKWGNQAIRSDFRDQSIKKPVSQCPEKNKQIPDIEKEIREGSVYGPTK